MIWAGCPAESCRLGIDFINYSGKEGRRLALKKSISKSIRISEEVFGYIDNVPGKGFNEKLENIILEAKAEEPKRKKKLADLEQQVERERRSLYRLLEQRRDLDEFFRIFLRLRKDLEAMSESLGRVLQNNDTEPEPIDDD